MPELACELVAAGSGHIERRFYTPKQKCKKDMENDNTIIEGHPMDPSAELPDTFMDPRAVVAEINRLAIKTLEQGAMEIGEYVLDAIFKGSLDEALSRNPTSISPCRTFVIIQTSSLAVDA